MQKYSTQYTEKVPERREEAVEAPDNSNAEEALARLYNEAQALHRHEDYDLEPKAYTEYCLSVASLLDGRVGSKIRAGDIYDALSNSAERALKGAGGATGVKASVETIRRDDDGYYFDDNGEIFGQSTTEYSLGFITAEAYQACTDALSGSTTDWARASKALVEDGDIGPLHGLTKTDSGTTTTAGSNSATATDSSPATAAGTNQDTNQGPGQGTGPAPATGPDRGDGDGDPTTPAPNGCDVGDAEQADNRRSERSDRRNGSGRKRSLPPSRYSANTDAFKTRGTYSQREYLDARARMQAERLLFLHLLSCALEASYQEGEDEGWITVEAEKMEEEMGAPYHSTYKVWRDSDLIVAWKDGKYIPPSETEDGKGKARMFRIPDQVLNEWLSAAGDESRRWWLHTPEPQRTHQVPTMTCDLSDDSNNRPPELVYKALKYWEGTTQPFDLDALDEALGSLSERDWKAARAQHASLQLAQQTIIQQAYDEEGKTELQNAYRATFAGRIVFKKGGPQGLMAAVKEMAYAHANGYTNYDIKSCHTSGLKQVADELAELGVEIDVSPWEEYDGKYAVADRTGLPVILVKIVEHAIKYGAYLPSSIAQTEQVFEDSPVDAEDLALIKAAKKYAEDPDEALGKLYQEFGEMRKVVVEISDALLGEYYNAHQSGGYMHNACGVSFAPHNYDSSHKQRTQVMAWMLQGLEAAFIHAITILSEDYDYEPLHNDHDGLGVRGEIPDEAQERARDRSGFHRAELVEKAHADADDIEAIYGPEAAREKRESKPQGNPEANGESHAEPTESHAEASEEELVRRHLQRKRKKRRERLQGAPDHIVARHTPSPGERVELTREEVRRMRGRNASPPEPAA